MKHHEFSPSSLERLNNCHASYQMSKGLKEKVSEIAEYGIKLHKATETKDIEDLEVNEQKLVDMCLKFEESLIDKIENPIVYTELSITVYNSSYQILTTGTADKVIVDNKNKLCHLVDWKFGYNAVSASNKQFLAYATGLIQRFGYDVKVHVFQSAINHYDSLLIESCYVNEYVLELELIIQSAKTELTFNASDDNCRYCKAKEICPALKLQERKVSDLELLENLNDLDLAEVYDMTKALEKKIKLVKEEIKTRIDRTGECGGYEYAQRKTQQITDTNKAYETVSELINESEFMTCLKVSAPAIRELLISRIEGETEKEKKIKANEIIESFSTYAISNVIVKK